MKCASTLLAKRHLVPLYFGEKADVSTANISKTLHIKKKTVSMGKYFCGLKEKPVIFDCGVNCPFNIKDN